MRVNVPQINPKARKLLLVCHARRNVLVTSLNYLIPTGGLKTLAPVCLNIELRVLNGGELLGLKATHQAVYLLALATRSISSFFLMA